MFVEAALEQVDAELRDDIAGAKAIAAVPGAVYFGSGGPVYVPKAKPQRGAPSKNKQPLERLRAAGVPRDSARELLRAARLAAHVELPRPPGPGLKPLKRPSFIELALTREENKRTRAADGFFGWADRYPEFAPKNG
jgi:hypothetical protein